MNSTFGILCLDNEWRITSVSDAAAVLLVPENPGSQKLEGTLLSDLFPSVPAGSKPSPETLGAALSLKTNITVADFTCSPDSMSFVFCITGEQKPAACEGDVAGLYRQNKKLTAIGIFSGGIAHDYNNALTAVLGNISLAKFEAEQNRDLLDLLNDAEKASLRIKTLTERLSSYSRGIRLNKAKVNPAKLIEDICEQKRRDFRGVISFTSGDGAAEIEGDSQLLSMTFECVIQNAIEAVDPGNGRIDLDLSVEDVAGEEIFREMALIPGRYIKLGVRDNGSGIAAEKLADIFNPYYTTKEGYDGIGLALAYSILKRHRGFITVNSAPGQGSEFLLYIPLF